MIFEEGSKIDALAEILERQLGDAPQVAVVLGSGWKEGAVDLLSDLERFDLRKLSNWPAPAVEGHGAELKLGSLQGSSLRVALCGGRVHHYEGYSAAEIVRGVRALVQWGCGHVLLLNAAGSLREDRPVGSLMPFTDHINMGLPNPVRRGENCGTGPQFLDLVGLYDDAWRDALLQARPELRPGVYAGMAGSSYETPAEVRMLAQLGADAVGMSTIPEAIAAHARGAKVMAISLLTNLAAGLGGSRPSHEEVLDAAQDAGSEAQAVLAAALAAVPV